MDNTINIKMFLDQSRENAEKIYKEGAARTVELGDLIAVIGCAVESYIKTIRITEGRLPDPRHRRAVTMTTAGILMGVGAPEAFGLDKENMFHIAEIIYAAALSECGFGTGDPGEGAI